ncbi:MAG: DUF459 domain-containing protein [Ignavibacteriaceae bacterium]|nr:DUF459 domain-containing protein [Ignavibacteriaceae bacterium]
MQNIQEPSKTNLNTTVIAIISLLFSLLIFNSSQLYTWASRLDIGKEREIALSVTKSVYDVTSAVKTTFPAEEVKKLYSNISGMKAASGFRGDSPLLQSEIDTADSTRIADSIQIKKEIVFSKDNPAKILLIGDSMMGPGFGEVMIKKLERDSSTAPKRFFKHSTGLSRPDYFDWFAQIRTLLNERQSDIIIVMMGTNDAQGFTDNGITHYYGKEEWFRIYRERVAAFVKIITDNSLKVYWVGMPPMREPGFDGRMKTLSKIYDEEISKISNGIFVSGLDLLGDGAGNYTAYKVVNGVNSLLRANDGIHFTTQGGQVIADFVYDLIKKDFKFNP